MRPQRGLGVSKYTAATLPSFAMRVISAKVSLCRTLPRDTGT